jgi:hypothetical protein
MTIELTENDHHRLDEIIDTILTAFAENEVSLSHARSAFAHLITAAAIGNEGEVRSWLTPERVAFWREIRRLVPSEAEMMQPRQSGPSGSVSLSLDHSAQKNLPRSRADSVAAHRPEKEVPVFEDLKTKFEMQAEWRREKAEEYPNDKRNQKAAEIFDRLLPTVHDIAPNVIHSYRDFCNGRDPNDPLPAIEIEQEHLRNVGFHTEPQNAEEFLRELIDDLRSAGEASLRIVK